MAFRATLLDLFAIPPGTVLVLSLTEGDPTVGDQIETAFGSGQVIGLDKRGAQPRMGLDGQPAAPRISIVTDLPFPEDATTQVHKTEVRGQGAGGKKGR